MKSKISLLFLASVFSLNAFASLDDDESQFETKLTSFQVRKSSLRPGTAVVNVYAHDEKGVKIREYVHPDTKKVFAVTWSGNHRPGLCSLAGAYCSEILPIYPPAKTASPPGTSSSRFQPRGPNQRRTENLLILHGGHMRSITGKLILHKKMPSGLKMEDLP